MCGWLKDPFSISWQVVPADVAELLGSPAAMQALLGMKKIDIEALKRAK